MMLTLRAPLRELLSRRGPGSLWRHREAGWTPSRRGGSVPGHAGPSEAAVGAWRTGLTGPSEAGVGAWRTGLPGPSEAGVGAWRTGLTGPSEAGLGAWRTGLTGPSEAAVGGWRTGVVCFSSRRYTTVRGDAVDKNRRTDRYTSMVEPDTEETFVFLDPVEDDDHLHGPATTTRPEPPTTLSTSTMTDGPSTTSTMTDGPSTTSTMTDGPSTTSTMTDGPSTTSTMTDGPSTTSTMTDGPSTTSTMTDGPSTTSTMTDGPSTTSTTSLMHGLTGQGTLSEEHHRTLQEQLRSLREQTEALGDPHPSSIQLRSLRGQTEALGDPHPSSIQLRSLRGQTEALGDPHPSSIQLRSLRGQTEALGDPHPSSIQLRSLREQTEALGDPHPSSIQFTDTDFPLDQDMLRTAKKRRKKDRKDPKGEQKVFGSADASEPPSATCCPGCGALLHCCDAHAAGFMPAEKFKPLVREQGLGDAVCQRCYLLTHHQKALSVKMSAEDYRKVVSGIKARTALVLLIVDLLDLPDSLVPDLLGLVGGNKRVVVLGNKVDLLPGDAPNYLARVRRQLSHYCTTAGLGDNVTDVHLISAKTGYGVEELISSLQRSWKYKGDVFLVGTANAGKSTLFNILLDSDYCKSKGSELIHKATISPWPGTTLDLLKFPIINPTPARMLRRHERLQTASTQTEGDLSPQELKRLQHFSKQGYLVGRVGRTFAVPPSRQLIDFDPDSLAYSEEDSGDHRRPGSSVSPVVQFSHNELKDAHWLYDTPGIMKHNDLLSLLTEEEVKVVVPTRAIVPRTFVLKPGMTLFLGGVGRVDYIQGEHPCWLSVVASNLLPLHVTVLERADDVYAKHGGRSALLGVPMGGEQRMRTFPPLVWEEFTLEGQGHMTASADLTMSSAGWVAVTGVEGAQMVVRAHVPQGTGLGLRTPPLLPHVVSVKGQRLRRSAAYKTAKPPALVDTTLDHKGATRLTVQKKKKRKEKKK